MIFLRVSKEEESSLKRGAKKRAARLAAAAFGGAKDEAPKTKTDMAKDGPGVRQPDIELYCKAAADGESLGDCPFTHYIQVGPTLWCWLSFAERCPREQFYRRIFCSYHRRDSASRTFIPLYDV